MLEHARQMRQTLAAGAECLRLSRGALRVQHQVFDPSGLLGMVRQFGGTDSVAGLEQLQRCRMQFAPPQWRHGLMHRTPRQLVTKRQRVPACMEHPGAHAFLDPGVIGILRELA